MLSIVKRRGSMESICNGCGQREKLLCLWRHMAQHCRNRGVGNRIGKDRRLEYGARERLEGNNGQTNNLKEKENPEFLD